MRETDAAANTDFLKNLRTQTGELHVKLEQLPLSMQLVSPQLLTPQYVNYLQLMYVVNAEAEHVVFPVLKNVIPSIDERKKSPLILKDLHTLGAAVIHQAFSLKPNDQPLTTAFALGILYVIEGSTLGGRMIMKNVEKVLGLNEENGCAYFAGYKTNTGTLWKEFLNVLVNFEADNSTAEASIISGARYGFSQIFDLLNLHEEMI